MSDMRRPQVGPDGTVERSGLLRPFDAWARPLDVTAEGDSPTFVASCHKNWDGLLTRRWAVRWIACFLVLGTAARVVRYALGFPLGSDEAYLAANLIDKGYLDLLGPLNYEQVCPLFFLWGQLTCVKVFGFNEYALRLLPLVFGVASLFVFGHMAGRLFRGPTLVLALAVFAASYFGIRYSAEAKPYEADLLVALLLLAGTVEWLRCPQRNRWLWILAAFAPVAVGLSYAAVFVAGGISLAIAYVLFRQRLGRGWPAWIVYNLAFVDSFLGLFALSTGKQSSGSLWQMRLFWHDAFPPLARPLELPVWLVRVHAGVLLAHPFGGPHGGSTLTLLACAVGVVVLLRRRRHAMALACLTPLALNFVAAAAHRYPYGGHPRLAMYFAPACCLLAALGASAALAWVATRQAARRRAASWVMLTLLALLAAIPVGSAVRDLWHPYRAYDDVQARDFARRFWSTYESRGEVACLKTDLGEDFSPENFRMGCSAIYLCNQRIYSSRHVLGEHFRRDRIAADWPLWCVEYRSHLFRYEQDRFQGWLDRMRAQFELVAHERYAIPTSEKAGEREVDYVHVYQFVPKPSLAARTAPARR